MSLHEDIQQKMKAAVVQASEQDMNDLPPSWIANQVYDAYGNTSVDAHVQYACMEHLKQMARKLLPPNFIQTETKSHRASCFQRLYKPVTQLKESEAKNPFTNCWMPKIGRAHV